jgi:phage I-like protein
MSGKTHSKETRQKLSEANKGKHSKPRGPMLEEQKQKIRNGWTNKARQAAAERARNQDHPKGWCPSEETRQKMSAAKKGKPAHNKNVPRTDAQKLKDRIVALKRHLAKGKPCLKFTDTQGKVRYFVSEFESAMQLTGQFAPATLIVRMIDKPAYIPVKKSSLGWRILEGCKFENCNQSELLEHRPELK